MPTLKELADARMRTSMRSPEHLKQWLDASGRRYLVLDARELVDALAWPEGVDTLMGILHAYAQHRGAIPTGQTEPRTDPLTHEEVEVPIYKGETLGYEELDRAIRYLVAQVVVHDPSWSLEGPPL